MTSHHDPNGTMPLYVASLGGSKSVSGAIVGVLGLLCFCFAVCLIGVALDRYGLQKSCFCMGISHSVD